MKNLGIDIGGSFIKIGIVENDKLIHNIEISNKNQNVEDFVTNLNPNLIELIRKFEPLSIGIGFPGSIDEDGNIISAPNMTYWVNKNILDIFIFYIHLIIKLINIIIILILYNDFLLIYFYHKFQSSFQTPFLQDH